MFNPSWWTETERSKSRSKPVYGPAPQSAFNKWLNAPPLYDPMGWKHESPIPSPVRTTPHVYTPHSYRRVNRCPKGQLKNSSGLCETKTARERHKTRKLRGEYSPPSHQYTPHSYVRMGRCPAGQKKNKHGLCEGTRKLEKGHLLQVREAARRLEHLYP